MSGYLGFEQSVQASAPIELYRFIGPAKSYFYTSADTPIVFSTNTYQPVASKRNAVRAGTQADDGLSLELEFPYDCQVVKDYAYVISPQRLSLEVYRIYREGSASDFALLWKGRVANFSVEGRTCKMRVPSVFSRALEGDVPNVFWQNPCNHVLFDQGCKLSRSANTFTATVLIIGSTTVQVNDDGWPDGHLAAGEIVNVRTSERRMTVGNLANAVYFNAPFSDLLVGDTVQLVRGCDHAYTTCRDRFSNGINYGGHKDVPGDNPFSGSI